MIWKNETNKQMKKKIANYCDKNIFIKTNKILIKNIIMHLLIICTLLFW